MEPLSQLLKDLEHISFQNISDISDDKQDEVVDYIKQLQDDFSEPNQLKEKNDDK
ncbi:MAG: hypothetical protein ACSHXJ_15325 [Marinomonas colpomeniae]